MKDLTFTMAMTQVFGKNGQTLQEYNQELKALTSQDKQDFTLMLRDLGINVVERPVLTNTL